MRRQGFNNLELTFPCLLVNPARLQVIERHQNLIPQIPPKVILLTLTPCCCIMHRAYHKTHTEWGTHKNLFEGPFFHFLLQTKVFQELQLISNAILLSVCLAEHNTQPFVSQPAIWSLQSLRRLGFPLVSAGTSLQWAAQKYWDYCSGSVACLWPVRLSLC